MGKLCFAVTLIVIGLVPIVGEHAGKQAFAASVTQEAQAAVGKVIEVKAKPKRTVKRRKERSRENSGVNAETMRRLDELLMLDALRSARQR